MVVEATALSVTRFSHSGHFASLLTVWDDGWGAALSLGALLALRYLSVLHPPVKATSATPEDTRFRPCSLLTFLKIWLFFFKYECITSWSFRQQPSKTKCMSDKKSIVDEYDTNRFYFDDWPMALNISSAFVSHGMERSLRRSYNILITTSRSSKTALSWNLFFFSASIGNMLLIVYSVYLLASIYSWSHKFNLGGFTQSFQPH